MSGLQRHLDALLEDFDHARHRENDPVRFPHRYADPRDQEVVGLFSACLAYGRATLIGRALERVVERMGAAPADAAMGDDIGAAHDRFEGLVYRLTRGDDLARLWLGAGALLRAHGTLGGAFASADPGGPDLRPALTAFRDGIDAPTAHLPVRRSFRHLVSDPRGASPVKRHNLFLRWMVRGPDAVDLGLWRDLGAHRLVVPLDTHVHRLGRYLGLTARHQADWRTAAEITAALRRLDPGDPLRYDFALAHMGISGQCPTRRVESVCRTCPIRAVCRLDAAGDVT